MGEGHAGPRDSGDSLGRRWSLEYGMNLWGRKGTHRALLLVVRALNFILTTVTIC